MKKLFSKSLLQKEHFFGSESCWGISSGLDISSSKAGEAESRTETSSQLRKRFEKKSEKKQGNQTAPAPWGDIDGLCVSLCLNNYIA
jgi:hypothetical protein